MKPTRLVPFVSGAVRVGSVELGQPVMTASGTAGHSIELAPYMRLDQLGATVVKSLYHEPWPGNPAPRVHPVAAGMINAVAGMFKIPAELIEDSPFGLIGSVDSIIETIHAARERWGFSYFIVGGENIEEIAPVVAALKGK